MRTIRTAAAVLTVLVSLAAASPAAAGGWWSSLRAQRSVVAPGRRLHVREQFMFRTMEAAERARERGAFAYLIRGLDEDMLDDAMSRPGPRGWWALGEADAIEIGRVRLTGWDANLAVAHGTFTVPEVRPGRYFLMFCNAGCTHSLGDLTPARVRVVESPLAADLSERVGRLSAGLVELRSAAATATRSATATKLRVKRLEEQNEALTDELSAVAGRLRGAQAEPAPWWALAGWGLSGLLFAVALPLVWMLHRGRRRLRDRLPLPEGLGLPDEVPEERVSVSVSHRP